MALVEMIMPKMGESVMEATVLSWLKKEGESVEIDESVVEVATDKVDTEVPSNHTGVIKKILAKNGEVVPVGQAIAIIETEKEIRHPFGLDDLPDDYEYIEGPPGNGKESFFKADGLSALTKPGSNRFYSPLVRSIAIKENIPVEELDQIKGTGKKDRVTKDDLMAYINKRKSEGPRVRPEGALERKEISKPSLNMEDD
ncbi:MAG TPA: biotin/lipoyl-containing protein, partial [Cyclobacteriaceae bacterium]|nr:biotin/lipoyl-containing protein [Cyclobacteriaceae bacterium]